MARHASPRHGRVRAGEHLDVDMADCICPRPHRGVRSSGGGGICARDAVLPSSALNGSSTGRALAPVAGARGGRCRLVQLLLVPQEKVAAGEAPRALGAGEGLLLGVGSFMTLQMLQASEGSLAGSTYVGTRLIGLGGREVGAGTRLGRRADGYGGRYTDATCQPLVPHKLGIAETSGKEKERKTTASCRGVDNKSMSHTGLLGGASGGGRSGVGSRRGYGAPRRTIGRA